MKRRNFIKTTALASTPLLFRGIPVMASSEFDSLTLEKMALSAINCGKILVIIQQNGGNDGLNTVFPLDQWSKLFNARSNILMDESSVLTLNNNSSTGLHPAMTEMKNLYNNGKMMIVQGVSYPNPNYSHFRATDIWFTASGSNQNLDSGWLGRALDIKYPNYPTAYPSAEMSDPLAIQIGSTLPFSLQGPNMNMGYSAPDPNALLNVINGITDPAPNSDYGHELTFLRLMKDQSNVYRNVIQAAYNSPLNSGVTYPTNNKLADQLKIVAKLINGGLQTPVYIVNHPNTHDTHENQVNSTDKTQGSQAVNLTLLSQAIGAFQQEIAYMDKEDKVTGMTFSEFGRRIKSNASMGTDHGAAAPVIFFGGALNTSPSAVANTAYPVSGMIGTSPELPTTATTSSQVPMQFDYRQLYTTVMQDWLCMSESEAAEVLGGNYVKLPIFDPTLLSTVTFDDVITLYPNPSSNGAISLLFPEVVNTNVQFTVFSINGSLIDNRVAYVTDKNITLDYLSLASGTYILSIEWNRQKAFKRFVIL